LGKGTFWNSPKVNQTTKGWFKFRDEQEGEHGSGHLSFSFRFTAELDKAAQTEMCIVNDTTHGHSQGVATGSHPTLAAGQCSL
jgi:hypothetical protein